MNVHVERQADLAIVRPEGRFFGGTETIELERKLGALIDEGVPHVVIDLGRTLHLNSTAISVLLGVHQRTQARGASLRLCSADRGIHNILVILKLVNVLPVDPDLERSLQAIRAGAAVRAVAPPARAPQHPGLAA